MLDYEVYINGVYFSNMIERDSYQTQMIPVYTDAIQTMDGVTHTALIRHKGAVSFGFNPQSAEQTKIACEALLNQPCNVVYFDLQNNMSRTAKMVLESMAADYLSRCLHNGLKWNQMAAVELTEL